MKVTLFADYGCPYAHRIAIALRIFDVQHELRAVPVGHKPPGLAAHSPSERIPLLVIDDEPFTESSVIVELLAELHAPRLVEGTPLERAQVRRAIAQIDELMAGEMFGRRLAPSVRYEEMALLLASLVAPQGPPNLVEIAAAPFWWLLRDLRPDGEVVRACRAIDALGARLDEVCTMPAVVDTAHPIEEMRRLVAG